MNAITSWLGQRRKAIASVLGLGAELIAQAIPQTNPQNALLLHSVLAVVTVWMVHASPNDPAPSDSLQALAEDLVHGDPPARVLPPVPPTAPGIG